MILLDFIVFISALFFICGLVDVDHIIPGDLLCLVVSSFLVTCLNLRLEIGRAAKARPPTRLDIQRTSPTIDHADDTRRKMEEKRGITGDVRARHRRRCLSRSVRGAFAALAGWEMDVYFMSGSIFPSAYVFLLTPSESFLSIFRLVQIETFTCVSFFSFIANLTRCRICSGTRLLLWQTGIVGKIGGGKMKPTLLSKSPVL